MDQKPLPDFEKDPAVLDERTGEFLVFAEKKRRWLSFVFNVFI
jgi:hypothetical protein